MSLPCGPLPDLANPDLPTLTAAVCDIPSVSGSERDLADAVFVALSAYPHLEVLRDGDAVVARTRGGKSRRVAIAGHLDTVPISQVTSNLPTQRRIEDGVEVLWGRGTVDMKGGVAVMLALAAELVDPVQEVTWIFYDHEEVEFSRNGLGRVAANHPDWLEADFAILCEPTDAGLEAGCNGTLRADVVVAGQTAHSARAWRGENAIHKSAAVLQKLANYQPETVVVDGLEYRESLNAVFIDGGLAGNMIPDRVRVSINYRFAPSRGIEEAVALVEQVVGAPVELLDAVPGARPGLQDPAVAGFVRAVQRVTGTVVGPKYGWTDVARFSALGIPGINFGPGDPMLAHADNEQLPVAQLELVARALRSWLTGEAGENLDE